MRVLYFVSFVFQDPNNLKELVLSSVMVEGLRGWDREKVLTNARFELEMHFKKQNKVQDKSFVEQRATYITREVGIDYE